MGILVSHKLSSQKPNHKKIQVIHLDWDVQVCGFFGRWFLILNVFGTPSIMTFLYLVDGRWYIFGEHGLQKKRTCLFVFFERGSWFPIDLFDWTLVHFVLLGIFFFRMTEVAHVFFWCKEFWLERCHDEGQGVNFWDKVCATLRVSVGNFIWWVYVNLNHGCMTIILTWVTNNLTQLNDQQAAYD